MDSKPYNVVLIPEEKLVRNAVQLSKSLTGHNTLFILDGINFFPHLSLYMLQLDNDGLEKTIKTLSKIAGVTSVINATAPHFHFERGYL